MSRVTYTNHKITTVEDLRNWILTELGYPLITVELTESQLDQAIDNAFGIYTKYADFGEKYLALNMTEYDTVNNYFNLSAYNIAAVYGLDTEGGSLFGGGGDTIFTVSNAMMQNGSYPFFGGGGGNSWVTYHAAHEWMDMTRRMMGSGYSYDYDVYNKTLRLMPSPTNITPDSYLLICCEVIPADAELYGNEYLKRFALAYAKIILGNIRKKFGSIALIGGGQIDSEIGSEGMAELEKLTESVKKDESMGTGFYIG
jgi:hypothetical protein